MTRVIDSTDDAYVQPDISQSGLYLVSTPIGNLRDITLRALDVLKNCTLLLCEDTRITGKLLSAYGLKKRMAVYNDHASESDRARVINEIRAGGIVAMVSDAGTPLLSDPGYKLVQSCLDEGLSVIPVPGANALLPALQMSALPSDQFFFAGFAPRTTNARHQFFAPIKHLPATIIIYESPTRLHDTLTDALAILGDRPVALAREITKMFETCTRGTLAGWVADPALMGTLKGEAVLLIGGHVPLAATQDEISDMLRKALKTQSVKDAAAYVAAATSEPRRKIYDLALKIKNEG